VVAVIKRYPSAQTINPRWPDLTALPSDQVRLTYDRPTDTLFVDFYGEVRPAASIPLDRGDRDYVYLRVDPETDAVVGLQIEHFLSYAIKQHPELGGALDTMTLVGISRDDLERITRVRSERPQAGSIATLMEDLARLSD
jgi:hypothetical protein